MGVPDSALATVPLASGDYDSPPSLDALRLPRVQQSGLLNRLDIQRSLLEYAAAEARLQLEIARQYPDIQLNPGYDFDEGHHKFTFGPTFPVPVWNRNSGPIAQAAAMRSEAEARFLALQSQVIGEMEQSLAGYEPPSHSLKKPISDGASFRAVANARCFVQSSWERRID